MGHIVLTAEQARVVAESSDGVEVRDEQGQPVAFFRPYPPEFAADAIEAQRRLAKSGPRIPAEQVRRMLERFHEVERQEGMTDEKSKEIVRRVISGEPL